MNADEANNSSNTGWPLTEQPLAESPHGHDEDGGNEGHDAGALTCTECGRGIREVYYQVNGEVVCAYCREPHVAALMGGSPVLRFAGGSALGLLAAIAAGSLCVVMAGVANPAEEFTNVDFGLCTILSGFLIGAAVKVGSRKRGGWVYQLMAMFLTYSTVVTMFMPVIHVIMAEESEPAPQPTTLHAAGHAEGSLTSADGSQEQTEATVVWDEMDSVERALYCVFLYAIAFVTPVLMLFGGIVGGSTDTTYTWLLLIGIALAIAWYKNRRFKVRMTGPHEAAATTSE